MKLSTRIILLFTALALIPQILAGSLIVLNGRQSLEYAALKNLQSTNELKTDQIQAWLSNNLNLLEVFTISNHVSEYMTSLEILTDSSPQNSNYRELFINTHMNPFVNKNSFESLSILDSTNGKIILSTNSKLEGKYREHLEYFTEGKKAPFISKVFYSIQEESPVIFASAPIKNLEQETIAVAVAKLRIEDFTDIVQQQAIPTETMETYLINSYNFLIADTRFLEKAAFRQTINTEGVEECLNGNQGTRKYKNYRNTTVYGAYHWLPSQEMCILTEIAEEEALAPTRSFIQTAIYSSIIEVALVIILGKIFSNSLVKPIEELIESTNKLTAGKLSSRISVTRKDEFGQLGKAFNQMGDKLETLFSETKYRQNLVMTLYITGEKLHQAKTHEELYDAVGSKLDNIGLVSVIYLKDESSNNLNISHISLKPEIMEEIEKIYQTTPNEISLDISNDPIYKTLLTEQNTIFIDLEKEFDKTIIYPFTQNKINPILDLLKLKQTIYTPIKKFGKVIGILELSGKNLSPDDIPVISLFSNALSYNLENIQLIESTRNWANELESRVVKRTQELQNTLTQLERSNEELAQFAYITSHDLQEPLRIIASYMQLLEKRYAGQLDEEAHIYINYAIEGANRLKTMITNILEYTSIQSEGKQFKATDLNIILKDTLQILAEKIKEKNVIIKTEQLPIVHGDQNQILQVFKHLIDNSIKFNQSEQPTLSISCKILSDDFVQIDVNDNGIGIEKKYFERIFEIFKHLHPINIYPGTGIGLAISKRIIERHGGEIWLTSKLDHGSTFSFTLMRAKEQNNAYSKEHTAD